MTHRRHGGERGKQQSQHGEQQAKASRITKRGVILCHGGQASEDCPGIFALERDGEALEEAVCFGSRSVTRPGSHKATESAPRAACSRPPTSSAGFGNERNKLKAFSKAVLLHAEVGALLSPEASAVAAPQRA